MVTRTIHQAKPHKIPYVNPMKTDGKKLPKIMGLK